MTNKFSNHRIWHFIEQAKLKYEDSLDFYHPVSLLSNRRYEELCKELNEMGYSTNSISNPNGNSLTGIIRVGNLLIDVPYYEPDDGPLTSEQLEEIQRIADERYFAETGKHLPSVDDPGWVRLFDK